MLFTSSLIAFVISFIFFFYDFFFFFNPELFINIILFLFMLYFIYLYNGSNQKINLLKKNELKKKNFLFIHTILLQWKKIQIRNKIIKKFFILLFLKNIFIYVLNCIFIFSKKIHTKIITFITSFFNLKLILLATKLNEKETIYHLNKSNLLNFWFYNTNHYNLTY